MTPGSQIVTIVFCIRDEYSRFFSQRREIIVYGGMPKVGKFTIPETASGGS